MHFTCGVKSELTCNVSPSGALLDRDKVSVSPRVHLQPGLQLSSFGGVHPGQDVPAVHVDDLHRKVTHLARLVQGLQEEEKRWGPDQFKRRLTGRGLSPRPSC